MKSEFGKGLTYCIGLFLAHTERHEYYKNAFNKDKVNSLDATSLWFNTAADHLYELNVPDDFPQALTKRILKFQSKCFAWRGLLLEKVDEKHFTWAIEEAQALLMKIDKHYGIATGKAEWA